LWDNIFARKEDAPTAQRVRMVTIWHGAFACGSVGLKAVLLSLVCSPAAR
jgi:hypothetical protein